MRTWMTARDRTAVVSVLLVLGAGATGAEASKCVAAKLKATGQVATTKLNCHAKAVGRGVPVDPVCIGKAETQFAKAFADAESMTPSCTPGDAAAVAAKVQAMADDVANELGGPGPSSCTRERLKAAGRKAVVKHRCHAAAALKGPVFGVSYHCILKAESAFARAFSRAASKGDCTGGTEPSVEARVDAFLLDVRTAVAPPIVECAPVQVSATHGADPFWGNTQLARIEKGRVPCVHRDKLKATTCLFSTASGSESGAWVESPQGSYAVTGQAISPKGTPGGEYVVGGRVSDDGTLACIEPSGSDMVGAPAGVTLAAACSPESLLSPQNSTGFPLENHATREVCTSSCTHPDAHGVDKPMLTDFNDDGVEQGLPCFACWTGEGAALNDVRGIERDVNGIYLSAAHHCHFAALGNVTFPVAKRPSLKVEGGVLVVDGTTPIVWRPVVPGLSIANE